MEDAELEAMQTILGALRSLDAEAQRRVIRYVWGRTAGAAQGDPANDQVLEQVGDRRGAADQVRADSSKHSPCGGGKHVRPPPLEARLSRARKQTSAY